jgi:hypothetical protein
MLCNAMARAENVDGEVIRKGGHQKPENELHNEISYLDAFMSTPCYQQLYNKIIHTRQSGMQQ